jgi:hypothetical protein
MLPDLTQLGTRLGGRVIDVAPLGKETPSGATTKTMGYGRPQLVTVRRPDGQIARYVFHLAKDDDFGHDRRADRAEGQLLAFDSFPLVPGHVAAVDVGAIGASGELMSLRDVGELYLVTQYAPGEPYATDLRRIARTGEAEVRDLDRVRRLVDVLVHLHALPGTRPAAYTRAIRDLLGHGEGIFGIIDGYADDVPLAPPERLRGIEALCLEWRWRLKGRTERLRRTHGDFHPFNILFDDEDHVVLLDTSRGSQGDPADDVACLGLNYLFFALERPGAWRHGLGRLWDLFWSTYLERSGDLDLLGAVAPFLAWRGLVLANPRWYAGLSPTHRAHLLGFVERALAAPRFDPRAAHAVFA